MPRESNGELHVFAGSFAAPDVACQYTQEQWEPEPSETAIDAEYAAWEVRNPTWGLANDLKVELDSDFIETIGGDGRYDYLGEFLLTDADLSTVRKIAGRSNTLVLIFPDALYGPAEHFTSTPKMVYCGSYAFEWA